jgi:hypothetical protein
MSVNLDILLQASVFDFWAIPATFVPVVSQPGAPSYPGRGIYNTWDIDVAAEDGSIFNDQRTLFDIRISEFDVVPQQKDHVVIPFDANGRPLGEFEIIDAADNGGGQIALTIRKVETVMVRRVREGVILDVPRK